MKVIVLGCGSSLGIPVVGCDCAVCTSTNPKNKRTRTSICIQHNNKNILIDTSPDLRFQLLNNQKNSQLNGQLTCFNNILYTHEHADHCHGIDDLRIMRIKSQPVTIYGAQETIDGIYRKFSYMFEGSGSDIGFINSVILNWHDNFELNGLPITTYKQRHGNIHSSGYKIGNVAYSTDVEYFPPESMEVLQGGAIDIFIVGCIAYTPHYSHAHLEKCLQWVDLIKPRLTVLTHLGHHLDYDELSKKLPKNVIVAYDGMVLESV